METNIHKWGNSLGMRISKEIAHQFALHDGSLVEVRIENDHISIYPKKYLLTEMLQSITDDNKHTTILDDEKARGSEEW